MAHDDLISGCRVCSGQSDLPIKSLQLSRIVAACEIDRRMGPFLTARRDWEHHKTVKIRPGQPDWAAVDPHLDQLLEMPESEWEPYLTALEIEQPAIAAALREMMADRLALEAKDFLKTSLVAITEREAAGTQLGAYTLRSLIGRG